MKLTKNTVKNIIYKLLQGKDYRDEVVNLIDEFFLQDSIKFFKSVAHAKLENLDLTDDWYKKVFLREKLPKERIAINAGLNMKTIQNSYNSTKREIVIEASAKHYQKLRNTIQEIIDMEGEIDWHLSIRFKSVSVDLDIKESLIIINTLAVRRAALRGGLWSAAGKNVEKPLMQVLCGLYNIADIHYRAKSKNLSDSIIDREVDFYLVRGEKELKCEVKLMGKGNPESADGAIARDSDIFIADKLSDKNKEHLQSRNIEWVELRSEQGFRRFKTVLENLQIPHAELDENHLTANIEKIFENIEF